MGRLNNRERDLLRKMYSQPMKTVYPTSCLICGKSAENRVSCRYRIDLCDSCYEKYTRTVKYYVVIKSQSEAEEYVRKQVEEGERIGTRNKS